jgi:hypothetical protein
MEGKKLLPAIVAFLLTTSVLSISTTSVSGTYVLTVSIDKDLVKANTPMVRTITVANGGPGAIDNVRIILEAGSDFAPLKSIPKDNIVRCYSDNIVVLPAGTVVELLENENILLPEGTDVTVENGKWILVEAIPDNTRLDENTIVEVRQDTSGENILVGDNIEMTRGVPIYLENDNRLRMVAPTLVVLVGGNIVKLPENTLVGLYATNDNGISEGENVRVTRDITVTLADNRVRMVTNKPANLKGFDIPTGENVQLYDNRVVLRDNTIVKLGRTVRVRIAENENVIREKDKRLDVTGAAVENRPDNWTQTTGISDPLSSVPAVEWKGIGDNKIPAGGSLSFPFALTTPSSTGDYRIWVRTPENISVIILKVDGTAPTVTVTASPSWVKDNVEVTITVKASETLSKLENVMVHENNAPENTQVTMSSTDNITWTGTYRTGDNWLRDGEAKVYVIGAQFEDLVGNPGSGVTENTFTIDRCKPPTPDLGTITGFPVDLEAAPGVQTNIGGWTLEGTAKDNLRGAIENLENGTVRIRVGAVTYDVTAYATGYFFKSITLTEGTQEVGIRYIDRAGNVGEENAENVTYDKTPPSFSMTSPGAGSIIKDNTPSFAVVITDAVMGVENDTFDPTDNSGYIVQLCRDDNSVIAQLTPKAFPTSAQFNSFTFENDYLTELPDNFYKIFVQAGDNLQSDNAYFRFEIDTTPPAAPTLSVTISQNPAAPDIKKSTTVSLGGTCEAYATVRVWVSTEPFTTETVATEVVDTDGDGIWTASITVSQGVNTRIRVSAVDRAGNESTTKTLYGYLMVDGTAPTVSITSPATGTKTDKASIEVRGTVTKDAWEDWADITLRVQVGLTSTTVPISAGSFSVNVALAEGTNTIIASVTDVVGNTSSATITVERTVTPWGTYAIILVIVALILAAIAIFRKR